MLGPVGYQARYLGRKLWAKQREMCGAVFTSDITSVKGCHGSGKTFAAAGLVPYGLTRSDESIVLTIAPTLRQVKTFWNEVHSSIESETSRVRFPEPTTTGIQITGKNYALGFSSSKGVNAQGFHGKEVLIIEDEAIGIAADLHDAIEGIRAAGRVRMLRMCNPTVPSGAPFEDFTRLRNQVRCITISAFDTPNLAGLTLESLLQLPEEELDYAPFPWLTRRRWVKEMYYKWGPTNPRFLSRVLGEFPTQADDSVFSLEWIEKASLPIDEHESEQLQKLLRPGVIVQVGVDVAGPGDDETAATARIGPYIVKADAWPDADPRGRVARFLMELRNQFPGGRMIVVIDTVGVGYNFGLHFLDLGYDVRPFVAGMKPREPTLFVNWKAEAYWGLRELMQRGHIRGIADEDAKAQLSDIRYRETPAGRIEIEPKDEARKRGSQSPDRAESVVMAFSRPVEMPESQPMSERVVISQY